MLTVQMEVSIQLLVAAVGTVQTSDISATYSMNQCVFKHSFRAKLEWKVQTSTAAHPLPHSSST